MIDWATSHDVEAMLAHLPDGALQPELRLFAADCASRVLQFLPEPEFSALIAMSRRFADDESMNAELRSLVDVATAFLDPHVAMPTVRDFAGSAVIDAASCYPATAIKISSSVICGLKAVACAAAELVDENDYDAAFDSAMAAEAAVQSRLLRARISTPHH